MAQRCSCELTLALLERFGGNHAARMRRAGNTRVGAWGPNDWRAHMREEETLFFPLLPTRVSQALEADHVTIRHFLDVGGENARVPDELAVDHAELEDLWAEHLAQRFGWNLHEH